MANEYLLNTIDDLIELVANEPQISLYGAGSVTEAVIKLCFKHGLGLDSIREVIVTRRERGFVDYYGLPVIALENVRNPDVVVISTKSIYHEEIKRNLKNLGSCRQYYVSDSLIMRLIEDTKDVFSEGTPLMPRKAIKFEVHIVEHCNLNCKGCFHFSPLAEKQFLEIDEYERDCNRLSELFGGRASQILLLGGEPLLHPEIEKFINITREKFDNAEILIVTNGLLLPQMKESFWKCCKDNHVYIEPTKYPIDIDYNRIQSLASDYGVEMHFFNNSEVVKTLTFQPLDIKGQQDKISNFDGCYRANQCITLSHGRLYTCIMPAHVHHFIDYFGVDMPDFCSDGIDIYKAKSAKEISDFLIHPIEMCRYCDRKNVVDGIEWAKSKNEINEWM